jgi:hypothetical protein
MAKEPDVNNKKERKSPVAVAKEAMEATPTSMDSLPPALSLDPTSVVDAVQETILKNDFNLLRQDTVRTARLKTEMARIEAERELDERKSRSSQSPSSTQKVQPLSSSGLLSAITGSSTDKAAMVKSVLDSLESDEARLQFIDKHPELFSNASPQSLPQTAPLSIPQPAQAYTDSLGIASLLVEQFRAGMEIQRAASPSVQSQQVPAVQDLVQSIVANFKEINEKNAAVYSSLVKDMQEQARADKLEAMQKQQELGERVTSLLIESREKDAAYLRQQNEQLREALSQPQQIPVTQLKSLFEDIRSNGLPVSMDSPEQETLRAQSAREDRKLDHQLKLEEREFELRKLREERERLQEERRLMSYKTVGTFLNGVIDGKRLSKHVESMSPAASKLAGGF